jgi:methyl-accepting chemotaxis protein WspA
MSGVRTLTPRFGVVSEGMEAQSQSAGQISETMEQLNMVTQNTVESLREFKLTAEYLNEAALGLQNEVSRFKVGT